jgi:hypothetical protein
MFAYGLFIIVLSIAAACGTSTPEVVYENDLNTEKYVNCMTQLLTIDTQCRLQRDESVFEACMLVHSDYCVEQHTEFERGGVR